MTQAETQNVLQTQAETQNVTQIQAETQNVVQTQTETQNVVQTQTETQNVGGSTEIGGSQRQRYIRHTCRQKAKNLVIILTAFAILFSQQDNEVLINI